MWTLGVMGDQATASSGRRLLSCTWAPTEKSASGRAAYEWALFPAPIRWSHWKGAWGAPVPTGASALVLSLPSPRALSSSCRDTPTLVFPPPPTGTAVLPMMPVQALHCLGKMCAHPGGLLLAGDEVKGPEWGMPSSCLTPWPRQEGNDSLWLQGVL